MNQFDYINEATTSYTTWPSYGSTVSFDMPASTSNVYVIFRDAVGNISTSSITMPYTLNITMIQDTSNLKEGAEDYRLFISWKLPDEPYHGYEQYLVYRSYEEFGTFTQIGTFTPRSTNYYTDTTMTASTSVWYKVAMEDQIGNISYLSKPMWGNANGTQDAGEGGGGAGTKGTPPTITNVTATSTYTDQTTIVWDTNESADSLVYYMTSTGGDFTSATTIGVATMVNNSSGYGAHQVVLPNLTPSTTYYYIVKSTNPKGDSATSTSGVDGYSFTTKPGPVITHNQADNMIKNTWVQINWATDLPDNSYVTIWPQGSPASSTVIGQNDSTPNHSVTIYGLTPGMNYVYFLTSGPAQDDNDGVNYSFTSATDGTPPSIISLSAVSIAESTAAIAWLTNELATSTLRYGTNPATYDTTITTSDWSTGLTIPLNSLTASTTYYYQLEVADQNGNSATSSEQNFTTLKESVLKEAYDAYVASTSAEIGNLNTQASTSASTTQANIDSLNNQITSLTNQLNNRANLTPAEALDLQAQVASLTTQLAAAEARAKSQGGGGMMIIDKTDKVAPVISSINIVNVKSDSIGVNWKTNEEAIGIIRYGIDEKMSNSAATDNYVINNELGIMNLEPNTKYFYKISVFDKSGNQATSDVKTFDTTTLEKQLKDEGKTDDEIAKLVEAAKVPEENKTNILLAAAQKAMELMGQLANQVSLGTLESTLLSQSDMISKLAGSIPGPILGGEPLVVTGATTANISWITDKEANSLVAYAPESLYIKTEGADGYMQVVGDSNNLNTKHEVRIAGLKPSTVYHYQLRSKATLGPVTKSRDFTFKTREEGLEIITHVVEVKDSGTAIFRWSTNLESDSKLVVTPYRNGKLAIEEKREVENKITTTMHELTAKDLESGIVYQISMQSKDLKNRIAEEVIEQFTTSKDDLPPTINSVQTESALSQGKQLKVQTIISWQTNEPTIGQVEYIKGVVTTDQEFADKTPVETTYGKKHVAVVTKFDSGQVYTYRITVTDSSGNKTISKLYTILTPKQKESVFQLILKNFEDIFGWVGKVGN